MTGFVLHVKDYMQAGEKVNKILEMIFAAMPSSMHCEAVDYEFIVGKDCVEFPARVLPQTLAEDFSNENSLLVNGRFFCALRDTVPPVKDTMSGFWNSDCITLVLVYDVAYIEVYSKDRAFLGNCAAHISQSYPEIGIEYCEKETCERVVTKI